METNHSYYEDDGVVCCWIVTDNGQHVIWHAINKGFSVSFFSHEPVQSVQFALETHNARPHAHLALIRLLSLHILDINIHTHTQKKNGFQPTRNTTG